MRAVKSSNTAPERRVGEALRRAGLRAAAQAAGWPGRPDFFLKGLGIAVFVEGCFWHGCPRHYRLPKSNVAFWQRKIDGNRARDRRNRAALRELGIGVVRVWECRTRTERDLAALVTRIRHKGEQLWRYH